MASLVENALLEDDVLAEDQAFESSVVNPNPNPVVRVHNPIPHVRTQALGRRPSTAGVSVDSCTLRSHVRPGRL